MNNQLNKFVEMIEQSVELDTKKQDFVIACDDIAVSPNKQRSLRLNGTNYELDFYAFNSLIHQLVKVNSTPLQRRSKITLSEYLWNNQDNGIFRYAVNQHLGENRDKQFLVRLFEDKIRVFLKPTYSILNNSDTMLSVMRFLGSNQLLTDEFKVVEHKFNRDFIKIKMLLNDRTNDEYGRGIYFSNNEIGEGGISFHSLVKRHICDNSIISAENFLLYHRGDVQNRLANVESSLLDSLEYSSNVVHFLESSKNYPVYAMPVLLDNFKKEYSASDEFIQHMEDEINRTSNTMFGFTQGITWAAQFTSEREEWEHIAGKILNVYEKKYVDFI